MFPSSGLFININCPFSRHGLCERPHCLYKHATEARGTFGGVSKSTTADLTGNLYGNRFRPVNADSLHELQRLEKEIETARHEVEQEQRRLSCYQTNRTDRSGNKPPTKCVASVSCGLSSSKGHKSSVQAMKYVVDSSKPRTDLEYDPLSNFSAALRSYSSSGKVKNRQDGRSSRSVEKPNTHQAQLNRPSSPPDLDDSFEDGVLVIDVSLSPDKTSDQTPNAAADVASETSSEGTERARKEIKTHNVLLDSSPQKITPQVVNATSSSTSSDNVNKEPDCCLIESNLVSSASEKAKDYSNDRSGFNLTGCLVELERGRENPGLRSPEMPTKINESQSFSTTSDHLSTPQIKLISNAVKYNPQLHCSLFRKQPDPDSAKQALVTEVQSHDPHTQSAQSDAAAHGKMAEKTNLQQTDGGPGNSQIWSPDVASVNPNGRADSSDPTEQLQQEEDEAVIVINSSAEEDELDYLEMELSDSDPMEECYRIFMEANGEERGNEEQGSTSMTVGMDVEKPEVKAAGQSFTGKKRVAHEAKNLEQPLAKTRPQPQILVPLREPSAAGLNSRATVASKTQQLQHRASIPSVPVKIAQNILSSGSQKKDTQMAASASTLKNLQPSPAPNACVNFIPIGTAVIEVGNNVHLILPQGSFPLSVSSTSSPVTSVLTPVSRVHPNPGTVKQTSAPAAVTPLPRHRSTVPVLIAAPARRPALCSALASTSVQAAVGASTTSQAAGQAAVKPLPVKRKLKQQSETAKEKVPHDVRQRYVNMFTEELLKTTADVNEAFEKALTEEKSVYNRSVNKLKYLSVAVNALKRLKNQSASAKNEKQVQNQKPKGNIPFIRKKMKENAGDMALYEIFKGYTLTDEQMIENNYPIQHPEKASSAVLFSEKKVSTDPLKRICCRCGATYAVNQTGKHLRKEECNYHYGKGVTNRVPGGVETRYSCCQGVMGAPGCQMFKLHVHDFLSLDGFVSTAPRCPSDMSCPGVYSLDCEMCYTVQGLELSRVTVINSNLQVVYDTFVRPDNEVVDYNTRFSGISEEDVKGNHPSLREVQETLLSFITADTILVGHGLETDLCLLKLLHGLVVDTSVVFPHRLGPPNKLSLNSLTAEYLRRIIQESVCGHNTEEDASACMELMQWKMKEDGKLKK
ncbi:RNA exonuclease 1 homolog [Cyprinodon tularosa]|uniref:RNA exonuclease 1 homolog n=1 Tax=Cyprinodon tularosa TaxID=77115 RepID=UPI0018E21AB1|nr:RNA exonuclease 1 homolog [Cyprinodon tularosa]